MDVKSAEFALRFPKTHNAINVLAKMGIEWDVLVREQNPDETDKQYDESMSRVFKVVKNNVEAIRGDQLGPLDS